VLAANRDEFFGRPARTESADGRARRPVSGTCGTTPVDRTAM